MTEPPAKPKVVVRKYSEYGPHISPRAEDLPYVRDILDRNGIPYWIDSGWLIVDGVTIARVNFKRKVDATMLQALFDAA